MIDPIKKSISCNFSNEHIAREIEKSRGDNQLRLDKLTLLSGKTAPQESKLKVLKKLNELNGDNEYCVIRKGKSKIYMQTLIVRKNDNEKMYLRVSYLPREIENPAVHFVRIETSPQHFTFDQFTALIQWLSHKTRVGDVIYKILNRSIISRIDIAFDIYNVRPRDFYVGVNSLYAGGSTVGGDGYVRAWKIGGVKSDIHLSGYEKELYEEMSGSIRKPCSQYTRLEFRIKPYIKISKLADYKNPFLEMRIYSTGLMDDDQLPKLFKLALNYVPVGTALHLVEDRNMREKLKRRLDRHIVDHKANEIWEIWPECIKKLNALINYQVPETGDYK